MDISKTTVAILAGGLATRLKPLTERIPKSLVPVAGRSFIHYQIDLLRASGIRHVVLCTGYLGEKIEAALGDGGDFGVHIDYSWEGPELLGTAGALRKALSLVSEPFFVLYGDSYLPIDYRKVAEAYRRSRKLALMTVYANANRGGPSNVWFEGPLIRVYDKKRPSPEMKHIDYGFSAFSKKVFQNDPARGVRDLSEIFRQLIAQGELAGYEVRERFFEIGSPEGLAELEAKLKSSSSQVPKGNA